MIIQNLNQFYLINLVSNIMHNLTNVNGLLSLSQNELIDQAYIKQSVIYNIQRILLKENRGWLFEEIEGTSLIPDNLISDAYTSDDYFKVTDDLSLKPETTALSYLHAKELLHHSLKAPLCVYQASKSFRKEQDQANKHMRLKEFKQLEFQCIYSKTTKNDYQMSVINDIALFVKNLLKLNTRLVYSDRLPSYSEKTIDIEVFNNEKWMEICSISKRNDFDENHLVLEIAFGLDRLLYNFTKSNDQFSVEFLSE